MRRCCLSPQGSGQELNEKSWEEIDKPMLVAAGSGTPSRRTSNPAEWRTEPYRFAKPGDKYLLWIEGMDGGYAGLCAGDEIDPVPATLVRDVTTAFWDAHLKGDAQARQRLHAWPVPEADKERFRLECKVAGVFEFGQAAGREARSGQTATTTSAASTSFSRSPCRVSGAVARSS